MNECAKFHRTVIIGNSGSGKSWLARRLGQRLSAPAFELDEAYWEPHGYGKARDPEKAIADTRQATETHRWIVEGVFGHLACEALPRASALIWLDLDESECLANIHGRGPRRGGDARSHAALIQWTRGYRLRQNDNSRIGHQRLFEAFANTKTILRNREEILQFLSSF